jgi:hypothetical protein
LLAQFYYADEELNAVATELDSFDFSPWSSFSGADNMQSVDGRSDAHRQSMQGFQIQVS